MTSKCKLFYQIDPPLPSDFPMRALVKVAIGQNSKLMEQVQDYGQVTYHSDGALPYIKTVKGSNLQDSLIPDNIPTDWQEIMPATLGFHMHENLELTLITQGQMLYLVDGKWVEVKAGDVIFFGSYIPHAWIPDPSTPVNVIEITFKGEFLQKFKVTDSPIAHRMAAGHLKHLYIPAEEEETARRICKIAEELSTPTFGSRFAAALELNLVLLTLLRQMGSFPEQSEPQLSPVVRRAKEYIAAHLTENPSLGEIAAATYITPHHLSFLFKKQMGIGIADYMNQQKILRTAELLADSRMSILDIALQSGFTSKSNFYRVFKEYYGITPQQMRDALTEDKLSMHSTQHTSTEVLS
jgi:AraC-like DNA-binding protein/mannose-6-phosphate isomerase-like protein (cupin superfamily)